MNKKYIILLFLALTLVPLASLLLRPSMVGVDSYSFINAICKKEPIPKGTEPLSLLIFELLPCNLLALKLFTWVFYLFLIGILALLGYHFWGKNGLIVPLFAFLSLYWLAFNWELENDMLATPFLWLSIWLMLKNKKFEALILILLTGYFLWGGAWLFLILLGLSYLPALLVAIVVIGINFHAIIEAILPNAIVAENTIFGGMFTLFLLCIGWLGYYYNKKLQPLQKQAFLFIPLAILNGKYAYQAIPFLALGFAGMREKLIPYWKLVTITAAIVMFFIICYGMTQTFPKPGTLESVEYAVNLAKSENKQLLNDWDLGYYVEFYDYHTKFKGFLPNPDYNYGINVVMVTQFDLNFPLKKNFGLYKVYES